MALSTNSVFHFTQTLDNLKGILRERFKLKYCVERIESRGNTPLEFAVPIVSFCDIPLSQVSSHINKYGGYGIGLSKYWAKSKGLNPVLYLERNSKVTNLTIKSVNFPIADKVSKEILRYSKNYEGELYRNAELVQKRYRFYDEREWRYCLSNKKGKDEFQEILTNVGLYRANKEEFNSRISSYKLEFDLKHVTYIFVNEKEEMDDLVKYIYDEFKDSEELSTLNILITTIITSKQIKTDF